MRSLSKSQAQRMTYMQFGLAFLLGTLGFAYAHAIGLSALVGGMIAATGNLVFVWLGFAPYKASEPRAMAGRLYAAEIAKLVVMAVLLALVFKQLRPINPAVLLAGFVIVTLLPAVLALRSKN